MNYVIHNTKEHGVHEIEVTHFNSIALGQLMTIASEIFSSGAVHYILIDARGSRMLPLRVVANELRRAASAHGEVRSSVALVIDNSIFSEETAKLIKTIMERDRVEIFTMITKANFWLQMEMRRNAIKSN